MLMHRGPGKPATSAQCSAASLLTSSPILNASGLAAPSIVRQHGDDVAAVEEDIVVVIEAGEAAAVPDVLAG